MTPMTFRMEGPWHRGNLRLHTNRSECRRAAILDALHRRHLYASQGPEVDRLAVEGNWLSIETSPIRCVRHVGPRHRGKWIHHAHEDRRADFQMPTDWPCIRLEIEDACGKQAWTNPLGSMETA